MSRNPPALGLSTSDRCWQKTVSVRALPRLRSTRVNSGRLTARQMLRKVDPGDKVNYHHPFIFWTPLHHFRVRDTIPPSRGPSSTAIRKLNRRKTNGLEGPG
ncbi:hypothetical protein RRG08_036131 [Elysia crispata]|uniref:Uncharacterized protein n=1 Tax=Elysia crispata TaxID=231223 RepID=A0AAE0ZKD4_9GAST|nr:hypothetical protein RRG08_036131 [Elysia crispata]